MVFFPHLCNAGRFQNGFGFLKSPVVSSGLLGSLFIQNDEEPPAKCEAN